MIELGRPIFVCKPLPGRCCIWWCSSFPYKASRNMQTAKCRFASDNLAAAMICFRIASNGSSVQLRSELNFLPNQIATSRETNFALHPEQGAARIASWWNWTQLNPGWKSWQFYGAADVKPTEEVNIGFGVKVVSYSDNHQSKTLGSEPRFGIRISSFQTQMLW